MESWRHGARPASLYGFERVQKLAQEGKSAEQIVEAACNFGQQDDITVLSIRRLAAAEEPAEARVNLTAQMRPNGFSGLPYSRTIKPQILSTRLLGTASRDTLR